MATLPTPVNPGFPGVYQIEVLDRVKGGPGGIANLQAEQLVERTAFLKKQIDDAVSGALTFEYANRLKTVRSIAMTGDGSWMVTFDGSGNVTAAMTLANTGVAAGTYPVVTIDGKGRVTAARALQSADLPNSPVLAGTPTAPTAAPGTNSLQVANTAYVQAAIEALVASSPAALDTLKELADALGDDSNFAATMTNALANKADKAMTLAGYNITIATQAQAEDGADDTVPMTPQKVAQAIAARTPKQKQIQSIAASVAANALTLTLNPTSLDFRSSTIGSGAVNTRTIGSAISVTVPSGATLGTINGQSARLALLAIDNAGTVELAVANLAGGANLDETTLISTTAVSAAASSASAIYSATARTNVPFRVIGFIDITESTAGTWSSAPTTVQGAGGQALAAMSSLGYGQSWQGVTGARAASTTYYNTTGKPISVFIVMNGNGPGQRSVSISGTSFPLYVPNATNSSVSFWFVVPPGASYSIDGTFTGWNELR